MLNLKRKTVKETVEQDIYSVRFQDAILDALAAVISSEDIDKSTSAVVSAAGRAFGGDAFLFRRSGEKAVLTSYSSERFSEIGALLRKTGVRITADNIPLVGGREKIFELPFVEFDGPFALLGDMITSAACRKIQNELQFSFVTCASAKIETSDLSLLLLLTEKPPTLRRDVARFMFLLTAAYQISSLKSRLHELETNFDEQFVRLKKEISEKESEHLSLFQNMTLAAAVLDERGVITEANPALKTIAVADPVGQSFASLVNEESRREFIEFILGLTPGAGSTRSLVIGEKHYKAYVVVKEGRPEGAGGASVYLVDDSAEVALKRELGETIDALRRENESSQRNASDIRNYSEALVRESRLPLLVISEGKIASVSRAMSGLFEVAVGEALDDFKARHGLEFSAIEGAGSEAIDKLGRSFSVFMWDVEGKRFLGFEEISELRKVERQLRRSKAEADRLFNGFLPAAAVTNDRISRWNDMFGTTFRDFLETEKNFDAFLQYLGESPAAFKSELGGSSIVMRMCRTVDRKYVNLSAASLEDTIFLFLEDITEQENLKQQLRATQGLLSSAVESSVDEPLFIVENGVARAMNIAARSKLSIVLDEPVDTRKVLSGLGISGSDDVGEVGGNYYRVETASIGNAVVYRFRNVNMEVAQRAEMEKLRRRQVILRELAAAERFEDILKSLGELMAGDNFVDAKVIGAGTLNLAKQTGDVYLMTMASGRIEPSLSLSLGESDIAAVKQGGVIPQVEVPDTTFMNVVSPGASELIVRATTVGEVSGFASVAIVGPAPSHQYVDDIGRILESASSVAAGLHARRAAERKFEESGKITRAIVGLTGLGEGSFEDIARKTIDLLRQVYGAEAAGVYSTEGPSMTQVASNGALPSSLSVPALRFGTVMPANQLESAGVKAAEGYFFAVKSRRQKLALVFNFSALPPSASELSAVSSVSLDMLDSRMAADEQTRVSERLLGSSKFMSEFMTRLTNSANVDDVLKLLGESLAERDKESKVSVAADAAVTRSGRPMELIEKDENGAAIFEADFVNVGLGILSVRCAREPMCRIIVGLSIDKIRGIFAMKLPAAQNEVASLRSRLDGSREDYSRLRDSIEKIPASLRNARISIDNALSRLSFVQGNDQLIQEIRLQLAAAAKEVSADIDSSSRSQDELFDAVRMAIMETAAPGQPRVRNFDSSVLTEFRVDQAAFDLLKDLFANFVLSSGAADCEVLMMTAQPSPNESAEGKGRHIGVRLTSTGGVSLRDDGVRASSSIQTLVSNLEKLGYIADTRALGNELTIDVCEVKPAESHLPGTLNAILVEDDKNLVEEESQMLLRVFSRLKVAGDAVEAAKILENEKFAAAFIDLSLPSINGRELCRQIKTSQPECVTVLLTNREGEEKSEGVDFMSLRPLREEDIRGFIKAV